MNLATLSPYRAHGGEVVLDVVICHLRLQAAHEDLAVARLGLLRVHLLAIDDVLRLAQHLGPAEGGKARRWREGPGQSGGKSGVECRQAGQ